MKAVVLGDVGWRDLYHLGDEAMTEVAVLQLQARGVEPTLLSGHAGGAAELYGVPDVPRVGFWGREDLPAHRARLERLDKKLEGDPAEDGGLYGAIRDADFVVIAGGGNLNDRLASHVFERLAFKRIAQRYGKPLLVTSQTVGPSLSAEMKAAVTEIASYASLFGCRDAFSSGLLRSLVDDPERIVRTVDDVTLLDPTPEEQAEAGRVLARYTDGGPIAIGAFVGRQQSAKGKYVDSLSEICRTVVEKSGVTVLLVPHVGSFDSSKVGGDEVIHRLIEECSDTGGKVRALPVLRAGTVAALTRFAQVSFSTRYHPAILAGAAHVPYVGIAQSWYTSVKMRGGLGNFGVGRLALPLIDKADLIQAILHTWKNGLEISDRLERAVTPLREYQLSWWDAVCQVGSGHAFAGMPRFPEPHQYVPDTDWSIRVEAQLPLFEELSRLRG